MVALGQCIRCATRPTRSRNGLLGSNGRAGRGHTGFCAESFASAPVDPTLGVRRGGCSPRTLPQPHHTTAHVNADDIRQAAEALEGALGDPWDATLPTSYAAALRHDESELFPQDGWDALLSQDYFGAFIPTAEGGRLRRFDELLQLGRVVCRRDVTLGVAAGQCLLASLPVWIGGDASQRARVATLLRAGGAGGLALTEQAHGSDLAASELRAVARGDGYRLDGEKWCINNATRGAFITALARTDADGGPRGFSLFCVDKARVVGGLAPLPRLPTHGVRAADISGMRFEGAQVRDDTRVGREGAGLPLVLRTMQVSRTLCAAFSLGAADSALRLATDFALRRSLYGGPIIELPAVRARLSRAYRRVLLADAIAHVGTRALSVFPEQMSLLSAVVKVAVPQLAMDAIADCAVVLGARHYLRVGPYAGFQKLMRDAALISLFDGSAEVNRHILAGQLGRVSLARDAELSSRGDDVLRGVRAVAALDHAVPDMRWDALKTSNRGRDDLLTAALVSRAPGGGDAGGGDAAGGDAGGGGADDAAARAMETVAAQVRALDAAVRAQEERGDASATSALADRYVWLTVAASVAHVAAASPRCALGTHFDAEVLVHDALALGGLLPASAAETRDAPMLDALLSLQRERRSFGLNPFAIADSEVPA